MQSTKGGKWRQFLLAFGVVFAAELGDKTQLSAFSLASGRHNAKTEVFIGASLALILSSLLAVTLGRILSRRIPAHRIELVSGILFLAGGVWFILGPHL